MENTNNHFISHDQTIIEVFDEKYKKYLIPRSNIIKAKHILLNSSYTDDYITLYDKDNQPQSILTSKLIDLNEDNITYHWLEVPDIENQFIIVKREQLLEHKMTNEPIKIMDYYRKNKNIIPGKVCRKAKKYHPTEGEGIENILFKVQDENNKTQFVTKPQIKFAKKKRMLNDETFSIEITNKDNNVITVPLENIRNIDEENAYKEFCEIVDIDNNSIIVRKTDLQDLKEIQDKNLIKETIQHISDYNYTSIYKIKPNEQYLKLFPNKYSYIPNGESIPWITVNDINGKECEVKTSLIEYYINENINELSIYEEVNDLNYNAIIINPFDIVKNIMMTYDDISCKNGPFIELITQSGTKHLIRKHTIHKIFKLQKEPNDYINIKDSNNVQILTSIQKLNELDLENPDLLLIPLEDVTGKIIYVKKSIVIGIVNKIVKGESNEECESVIDNKGEKRIINKNFINDIQQLIQTSSNENSNINKIASQSLDKIDQISIPQELQSQIKLFFSSSNNNISTSNEYLHNFLTMNNYNLIEYILFNSNDPQQKFFSAESLIYLYTHYPLIINYSTAFDLYRNVLSLIYENAETLYKKTKYIFNTLVKLLCRIIRLFIFQNSQNRNCIYSDILSNIKDDSIYSLIIPFEIFTELIYQFQSNESVQFSSYHQFKLHKMILEFKDSILLPIFEYSITNLLNLFQHQIKTENFNEFVLFMNSILKCIIESLDYEEDLNSKEDNYAKYEIKPVYIPNLKRKTRDKTLDLHLISLLIQSLFESYLIILKSTNDPSKGKRCLILLQKFLIMKSMYLGEGKFIILELYQEGICDILFTKNGFVNHNHLCKIIYYLKKNFTYFDLIERESFLNYVFSFSNDTLIKVKSDLSYYEGLIYLMRFYGYFSHSIEMLPFPTKDNISNYIKEFCLNFINNFKLNEDVDMFDELSKAVGICGECEYMELLNKINEILYNEKDLSIEKKSFCILSGCQLIKRHYRLYLDEKMISKGSEDELKEFTLELDEMNNTMFQKNAIANFIVGVVYMLDNNINNNIEIKNEILQIAFIKFVKFYIKHFLSAYLKNKFIDIHSQILEKINLHSFNELLIYIIKALFYLSLQIPTSHYTNTINKSLFYLYENIKIEQLFNYSQQYMVKCYLGKLIVSYEELIPSLQSIYKYILTYNHNNNNNLFQKFYELIYKLFNLSSQTISLETNIRFYLITLTEQGINNTNMICAINALFTSITNHDDYSIIIELLMPYILNVIRNIYINSLVIDNFNSFQILQLMIDITLNDHNKINFNMNSQCPYQIISIAKELLCHYYSLAREIKKFKNENDKYKIQIKPIAMFIKIFNNIFQFVQLNILVQSNYDYIKSLFDLLSELIFSINGYDMFGYIDDFMEVFDLIKVIYCDFVNIKPDICKSEFIGKIIQIITLGFEYQCCNGKEYQLEVISKCSNIIYEWGKIKRQYYSQNIFNNNSNNEMIEIVFEQYGKQLSEIMNTILNKFVSDDKTLQIYFESYVKCLFVLIFQYEDNYKNIFFDIIRNSSLKENEKDKMISLFTDILTINSINNNDYITCYNKFKEKINNLYDNIKVIIINHSNNYMKY